MGSTVHIHVADDPAGVAAMAAATIAGWLRDAACAGRAINLGLAGGGSPRATYEQLRTSDIPWDQLDAWVSDERWVAPDHPDSNARMAREALVDHVGARFHPIPWDTGDPGAAAAAYDQTLRGFLPADGDRVYPQIVLLGLGDDGHIASLFPGTDALAMTDRLYVANWVADKSTWRLTATLPLLWAADRLAFIVTGAAKAPRVAEIIGGDSDLPAGRAAGGATDVSWFLDRAAAARLGQAH